MKYRPLAAAPLLFVALTSAILLAVPAASRDHVLQGEIDLSKLLGLAGTAAAALAFDRGDYLRRGWGAVALNYVCLLGRDATLPVRSLMPPLLYEVTRGALVTVGNVLLVVGVWTLARAWAVAGLAHPGSRAARVAAVAVAIGVVLVFAGPTFVVDVRDVFGGASMRYDTLGSDLGDLPVAAPRGAGSAHRARGAGRHAAVALDPAHGEPARLGPLRRRLHGARAPARGAPRLAPGQRAVPRPGRCAGLRRGAGPAQGRDRRRRRRRRARGLMAPPFLRLAASVYAVVFVAELPDKTALAAMVLASRHKPWPVLLGTVAALTVQSLVAVAAGQLVALLPGRVVHVVAGLVFLASAIAMWLRKADADDAAGKGKAGFGRALWTAFVVVFIAEWGDLTQIATAALAARYAAPVAVFVGATAALWSVSAIAVFAGNRAGKLLSPAVTQKVAAVLFAVVGAALVAGVV